MSRRTLRYATFAALLGVAAFASAEQKSAVPPAPASLTMMLCTQEGVTKGLKGKDLDEFVGSCAKAKKPGLQKNDTPVAEDMANC